MSLLFEYNAVHIGFGKNISHRSPTLDGNFAEVFLELQNPLTRLGFQDNTHRLGLTIGISAEIDDARTGFPLRHIVIFVTRNTRYRKTFDVMCT
ncbi:hypothetical protein SDC9_129185 [bioreactor metagenome]|uniref:Uncharacterized protein n=1 Tax=bioreactor metagenome TaxID=1076179 RepID=A0A645CY89_9ZZZZ